MDIWRQKRRKYQKKRFFFHFRLAFLQKEVILYGHVLLFCHDISKNRICIMGSLKKKRRKKIAKHKRKKQLKALRHKKK
jgi:hypothetical protein